MKPIVIIASLSWALCSLACHRREDRKPSKDTGSTDSDTSLPDSKVDTGDSEADSDADTDSDSDSDSDADMDTDTDSDADTDADAEPPCDTANTDTAEILDNGEIWGRDIRDEAVVSVDVYGQPRWVLGLGDIDGDGVPDWAVNSNEQLDFFLDYEPGEYSRWDASIRADCWDFTTRCRDMVGAGRGDLNGDGLADILLGDYVDTNQAMLYFGSPGMASLDVGSPDAVFFAAPETSTVQTSMDGDVNGDGSSDIATFFTTHLYISLGPVTEYSNDVTLSAVATIEEPKEYDWYNLSIVSDMDGDGFDELVIGTIGTEYEGISTGVFLYTGSTRGALSADETTAFLDGGFPERSWAQLIPNSAGDVNGDGYGDLAIGEVRDERRMSFLWLGPIEGEHPMICADAVFVGQYGEDAFFDATTSPGDLNGDGFDDILIGSPSASFPRDIGSVYVFLGPISGTHNAGQADERYYDPTSNTGVGSSISRVGDLDLDGLDDMLIAAGAGWAAYLLLGRDF